MHWNLVIHAKLATFIKLNHKWEVLVYINIEHGIYGSKCKGIFTYLLLDIINKRLQKQNNKIMLCFSLSPALFTFTTSIIWAKVDIFVYTYTREATYRCFYILTTKRTTQKLQTFEESGLTEVTSVFYVGNVDSMNQCQTVTCQNDSRCLLFFKRLTFQAV